MELVADDLLLRPPRPADLPAVVEACRDPTVARFIPRRRRLGAGGARHRAAHPHRPPPPFRDGLDTAALFTRTLRRVPHYEYRTDVLTHGFLGRKEDELDRAEFEARLNQLGEEGWEFDKLLTHVALHGERDGHLLVFRRERA